MTYRVNATVCKLYLNKVIIKKERLLSFDNEVNESHGLPVTILWVLTHKKT